MNKIPDTIRVMVVDDHTLFRSGLKMLLENQNHIEVAAEASSAEEALELFVEQEIDLVLMDITLKGMDGLEATRIIRGRYPDVRVIILTMHDNEPYLLQALKAGAAGYVVKEAATTELAAAIRTVMDGKINVHPSLMKILVDRAIEEEAIPEEEKITEREKEVLQFICLGYTNKEIADKLVISVKTVEKHKEHLMEKLNIKRKHELIEYAFKKGLVSF